MSHILGMAHKHLDWSIVDREATALGVNEATRRKWRQQGRRVPFEWQLKIIERLARQGWKASTADFDRLPSNPGRIAA